MGKSELARNFASKFKDNYSYMVWIESKTETDLRNSFERVSRKMQLPHVEKLTVKELAEEVFDKLNTNPVPDGAGELPDALFVFENAFRMKDDNSCGEVRIWNYLPKSITTKCEFHILITSQWTRWEPITVIAMEVPQETINLGPNQDRPWHLWYWFASGSKLSYHTHARPRTSSCGASRLGQMFSTWNKPNLGSCPAAAHYPHLPNLPRNFIAQWGVTSLTARSPDPHIRAHAILIRVILAHPFWTETGCRRVSYKRGWNFELIRLCFELYTMLKYFVVEFVEERSVEILSSNWLLDYGSKCYWPSSVSALRITSLVQKRIAPRSLPNLNWQIHVVKKIFGSDNFMFSKQPSIVILR